MKTVESTENYSVYCSFRLPCGVCTRTNSFCPLSSGFPIGAEPPMISVYAAPARYPYNFSYNGGTTASSKEYVSTDKQNDLGRISDG